MIRLNTATRAKRLRYAVPALVGTLGLATAGATAGLASAGGAAAASKPTYYIAYEGPLTGGNQQLGLNMKYAVELAIKQANAGTTFGALPFTLKYTEADDQGSPTQSPTAAQSLINNSKVVAVVGPAFSGATAAAEPSFSQASLATVSPSATNPTLATEGWHNFFRVVPGDDIQGPADAQFISKVLKYKTVDVVNDASTYGAGLAGAVASKLQSGGVTVSTQTAPGTTQCQAGTGDVSEYPSLATQIKSANPQLVFYGGYYCDFALLAVQLRNAGYTGQLMSDDGSLDPHYVSEATPKVADYTYISCPCDTVAVGKAGKAFAAAFQSLAGFAVGTYSAESYDATNTIISVMKSIGSKVTRSAVVAGLHKVKYAGLTKLIKFQSDGNIVGAAVDMYRVRGGKITLLGLIPDLVKSAAKA